MSKQIQVLIVEDNPVDAELLVRELRRAKFDPQWHRVETEADYLSSLRPDLDLILSDFEMPEFNGLRALELLKQREYEIPFIIVSGTIGEETAVAAIKQGAADYLLKDRLARVGASITHALEQSRLRKEYRQSEAARIESEGRFRLMAENITDVFWITSPDLQQVQYVSPGYERIWGRSAESLYAHPHQWAEAILPEDRDQILAVFTTLMGNEPSVSVEYRIARPDGTVRWVHDRGFQVRDTAGNLAHLTGIATDITERKQTEGQLLWKTAFFEAQVHSALDGILIVDSEGKTVLQNQRMVDLWSLPSELSQEVDDRRRLEWVTNQVRNPRQFAEKVAYLYAHPDEISRDEIELIDGRFFDRSTAPVRGKDGKYYGRIWAFRDITERKGTEDQMAEQAALLDKARDAIVVRDLEGNILFWNNGAERMYGWTRQEAVGRNIGELLYANPKKFGDINGLIIGKGEWSGELQHFTKDRRELTIEARWSLVRDNDGQPKSILAINTDVTEKKKIEAQFMRAQRMESIGTLAGGVAHDLNNILAPIMMSIDILKCESDTPETRQILETIEVSARRGADIVRQVLSFARGLEGQRIEVQPKHLLKDLENIIKDTFPKDIRLRFTVPNDTWTILGDPTQMHQILLNLCVNARDAMPNGGSLTVSVENCLIDAQYAAMNIQARAGRYVNISVTDSGTGIPPALLEKIFEPFFTTKEVNKGTGLGLSTVMAIVKSHDGIVNVYSEPGKGTTFKVYLPAMEASSGGRKVEPEAASLPRGKGETVLVVDDEVSILTITSQTLQAFGYRVLTATDGADAVAVYAQNMNEIAVVLTDMMMPVMDGPATIHALMRINPAVKIVAASGLNANGGVARVTGAGVKHFLTKPYTAGTLLKTMRTILDEV